MKNKPLAHPTRIFRKHPRQTFCRGSPLGQFKSKSTSRRSRISVKNAESLVEENPKLTKVKNLKHDQQFGHEVKNVSNSLSRMVDCPKTQPPKCSSRIRFFVLSGQRLGIGVWVFFFKYNCLLLGRDFDGDFNFCLSQIGSLNYF